MNRQRFVLIGSVFILGFALVLGACGSDNSERSDSGAPPQVNQAFVNPNAQAGQPSAGGAPAEAAPVADAPAAGNEANNAVDQIVSDAQMRAEQQRNTPRLVIKNGDLALMVENVNAALHRITTIAAQYDGYVVSSETTTDGPYPTGTTTVAVASDNFEAAMNDLREIGMKVLHDSATGQDVTSEYVDLESRLRSLEATRDRITTFLEDARNVDEALTVNEQLKQIELQIEEVKGRMTFLAGRSAYSTITISLREPDPKLTPTPTPTPGPGWSAQDTFDKALDTQESLLKTLADAGIWLVVFVLPYLLVAGVIALGWRRWGWRPASARVSPPPSADGDEDKAS
jgi:hypothetical protein